LAAQTGVVSTNARVKRSVFIVILHISESKRVEVRRQPVVHESVDF